VVRIEHEPEIHGKSFPRREFLRTLLHVFRRPRINPDDARTGAFKRLGRLQEIAELSVAERALITNPSTANDEHDRACLDLRRQRELLAINLGEREVRRLVADPRWIGDRDGEPWCGENEKRKKKRRQSFHIRTRGPENLRT